MKQTVARINLHGVLGEEVGASWRFACNNVSEGIRAVETLSDNKLYKALIENDKKGIKYKIIVNGEDFVANEKIQSQDLDAIRNSELCIKQKIETIDIVPVIEGANGNIIGLIIGIIVIIVGVILIFTGWGGAAIPIGIALIIGGVGIALASVINLLSSPPDSEDFRTIDNKSGGISYLFSGPQNTAREGGPVPVGYGRLLVGSHVIAASYEVTHRNAADNAITY